MAEVSRSYLQTLDFISNFRYTINRSDKGSLIFAPLEKFENWR